VSIGERSRKAAKAAAARLGLERQLERAYELTNRTARRDRIDNEHLRLLLAFVLAPDSNCIDIGAHRGDVLREMRRLAPHGQHIAFEPVPESHEALRREFPDVEVRGVAVSDAPGEASFVHVPALPSYSGFRRHTYPSPQATNEITVRVESLDTALPDGYVPTLIKVDVEGAERQVFEGAIETITRHRPTVVFEHGAGAADHYGTAPEHVYDLLVERAGLRIFDIDGRGPYTRSEFQAVFTQPIWNFVAHA
jgi:FkbM family methyltransferase